jgi:hypothetical protein
LSLSGIQRSQFHGVRSKVLREMAFDEMSRKTRKGGRRVDLCVRCEYLGQAYDVFIFEGRRGYRSVEVRMVSNNPVHRLCPIVTSLRGILDVPWDMLHIAAKRDQKDAFIGILCPAVTVCMAADYAMMLSPAGEAKAEFESACDAVGDALKSAEEKVRRIRDLYGRCGYLARRESRSTVC